MATNDIYRTVEYDYDKEDRGLYYLESEYLFTPNTNNLLVLDEMLEESGYELRAGNWFGFNDSSIMPRNFDSGVIPTFVYKQDRLVCVIECGKAYFCDCFNILPVFRKQAILWNYENDGWTIDDEEFLSGLERVTAEKEVRRIIERFCHTYRLPNDTTLCAECWHCEPVTRDDITVEECLYFSGGEYYDTSEQPVLDGDDNICEGWCSR